MSIADHFLNRGRDAGFVRTYDMQAARRQLEVSVILILVMAGSAIALGLMTRLDRPNGPDHHAVLSSDVVGDAET